MRSTLALSIIGLGLLSAVLFAFLMRAGFFLVSAMIYTGITLAIFSAIVWYWTSRKKGPADR